MNHFKLSKESVSGHNIGIVLFDLQNEKVNKFNRPVMEEFERLIADLKKRASEFDAIMMVSRKPGIYIAGADIQLIQSAKSAEVATELARRGQNLINEWEDLPMPTVMAINGACMGGGCELSLASSAIVMSNDASARIGLPECLLGIIPGMGGCVRMPWKVGIAQSLELILAGKTLTGEKAAKAGLADACLPKENFEAGVQEWIVRNLQRLKNRERIAVAPKLGGTGGMMGALLENNPIGRSVVFSQARKGVISKTQGHYPAPLEAIKVIESVGTGYQANFRGSKRDQALTIEAESFGRMAATPISKSLIRLFFMTEAVKKSNGLSSSAAPVQTLKVSQAGVLGAGVMGGGIAQLFADKGITVRMKDIQNNALEIGIQSALKLFKKALKRKAITGRQMQQKLNRIAPTTSFEGLKGTEVIVEAVVEKMDIKQSVLKELELHVSDTCVIASNTSSLSISKMQSVMTKPERFVGMHFFNPVHKMPLVEVIKGDRSSDQAVSQIFQLSKQLGKTPVVVKDSAGFLVNRLLMPYLGESAIMLSEGVPIEELDPALLKFGMPMGPIELIDEVGLDVAEKVGHILFDAFGERMNPPNTFEKLLKEKRLGKKTGSGFYLYEGKDRTERQFDQRIYSLLGIEPKPGKVSEQEMIERCVYGMINEAARCLEEKVVETPADVDLGMIMGTGFPPFRGGLMRYADSVGLKNVVSALKALEAKYGMRFKPSSALLKFADAGSFYGSDS
jgi:3-hydroxyacyl-CoA dehydrogenase/enoyl-CoA hydratase/3-hydroxybutyryl-CoA epimerase